MLREKRMDRLLNLQEEKDKLKSVSALGGADPKLMKLKKSEKGLKLALQSGKGDMQSAKALKDMSDKSPLISADGMKSGAAVGSAMLSATGIGSKPSTGGGAMKGLMAGAQTGNPYAAAAGAVLGALGGASAAKAAREKALAEIEADTQSKLGDIEQRKAEKLQNAFSQLSADLGQFF